MSSPFRHRLISYLIRGLLKPIEEKDVLSRRVTPDGRIISWQGRELSDADISDLRASAKQLKKDNLWILLENTLRYEATKKMCYESRSSDDLLFGKAMLYNLKVINGLLDEISGL